MEPIPGPFPAAPQTNRRREDPMAPPPWTPLTKAQCLMLAIELRRVRAVTQRFWGLDAAPESRDAN